jgi:P27 family predicted phage terminase small subunit
MANPRTPTHLKLVTGNPGKRAMPKNEPKPKRKMPARPPHLSEGAKKAWNQLSKLLFRMGVLTEADGFALEQLCETRAEILEAQQTIAEEGRYQHVTTKAGGEMIRLHPAVTQKGDAERRYRAWLNEFGLTPAARSKVKAAEENDPEDPTEKYFA